MERLRKALIEGSFLLDLDERDMASILHRALDFVVARGVLPAERRDEVEAGLVEREQQVSTAIGNAVAVPHTYLNAFSEPVILFVRLSHPTNLGAPDGVATRFVFMLLGPTGAQAQHLDTLANIARLTADGEFRYDAGVARTQLDLLAALDRFNARIGPPPRAQKEPRPQPLPYTGRLFGGWIADIRRRLPHYASDFRNGLHTKCVASTLFLFFACLAPAVTFGGIMGQLTGNQIGAVEMLVATTVCGIVYALFSGQPLIILGGTGPLLVFTAILYRLCIDLQIPFLPTYAWVGLWTALLLLVLTATDASCLMRYFSRFTDEIFAALISSIFIYEAIKALVHVFADLDVKQHHDTALLSVLLAFGTFYVALSLSRFRRSRYLLPWIREFLADFGPFIALAAMTLVAVLLHEVYLDVLPAPESFGTTSGRAWLINPIDVPMWVRLAAVVPAGLLAILVFLDQNITARLINSPDHKLQKGEAYHLDLGIVGLLIGACSLVGLPWLVAATVRSLNHVRSLATVEAVVSKNGETRERVVHVRENRITPLAIHVLIGLSLVLLPLLRVVPMAVLYGIFLYMGVVSLAGNQFFDRLKLWFMDSSLYPATHYIRQVPPSTIHKYTLLQSVCLAVLWIVKASVLGLLFPLFIAVLVPIRLIAGGFFAPEHLAALDSETEPEEEETHWA
jgi:mannitol/fructose-specific phosphotransferase system IIA component (Ntr-type)